MSIMNSKHLIFNLFFLSYLLEISCLSCSYLPQFGCDSAVLPRRDSPAVILDANKCAFGGLGNTVELLVSLHEIVFRAKRRLIWRTDTRLLCKSDTITVVSDSWKFKHLVKQLCKRKFCSEYNDRTPVLLTVPHAEQNTHLKSKILEVLCDLFTIAEARTMHVIHGQSYLSAARWFTNTTSASRNMIFPSWSPTSAETSNLSCSVKLSTEIAANLLFLSLLLACISKVSHELRELSLRR